MKEMCQLFLNRLEALPFHTSVGLILFGSTVKEICKPTPVLEHLRDEFDSIELNGDTSLFDAIHIATATLQEYCKDHPKIRKRILCITDGLDTSSEVTPWILASVLQSHQIVLDSIILDKGADNPDLTAVSKSSGGFAFAPETVRDAIKILELDTMLSLFERPELKPQKIEEQSDFSVFRNLQPDKCASNNLPLKINPIHSKKSMTLSAAVERFVPDNSLGRRSYLLIQLKQLSGSNHPKFDIFPSYDDLGFWKIIMEGPEGTPYE
uniref:UBC core domain-containing protein n=1 Tax=Arcella intermedia TaxID=1963864 RepID=A0A6B2LAJ6_9EUKA